jgi:hypothetical protein
MFRELPEQGLWLVKQHQRELIHEAEQYRLARAHPYEPGDHLATRLFTSIRASLERPFAGVRRALPGYEAPCTDLCLDCAPC